MKVEAGGIYTGKVSSITKFGAFLDLPDGKRGLVHISELSDEYVKNVREIVAPGQEVKVQVLRIEEDGKIALSMRSLEEKVPSERQSAKKQPPAVFIRDIQQYLQESDRRLTSLKEQIEAKR
ncbi:S1 RNA-binding domain-containing protein [Alkalicoccus daliensis]|uniref:S1 RNA binding domain protein n=1 Tax=Alkalicoccus daliensis TaxID=745820 RepID=A0A1H0KVR6_9BACI|nr:S1 RNA-binding domain-containing protein [Alkalicoccus daliensis]SDO59871.1 S1 RNA binding domain protein [Alkalicoccus daliensis]